MKRGGKAETHWGHVAIVLLAVALAGYVGSGELTGQVVYRDAGYGYGGGGGGGYGYAGGVSSSFGNFNVVDFYYEYASFIDALIFLMIFLSIGKSVIGKHFERGGKSLYVGVGLFLSIALLIWEEQNQFFLLEEFGVFALIILVLFVLVAVFKAFHGSAVTAGFAIPIVILLAVGLYKAALWANVLPAFMSPPFSQSVQQWYSLLTFLSIVWLVIFSLFKFFTRGGTRGRRVMEVLRE